MQAFEFYCPTKIYFGKGAEAKVGEAVKHFGGTKVFIVYGGHSAVKSGLIARCLLYTSPSPRDCS